MAKGAHGAFMGVGRDCLERYLALVSRLALAFAHRMFVVEGVHNVILQLITQNQFSFKTLRHLAVNVLCLKMKASLYLQYSMFYFFRSGI